MVGNRPQQRFESALRVIRVDGRHRRAMEVSGATNATTLGELAAALGIDTRVPAVDGVVHDPATPLDLTSLAHGSTVGRVDPTPPCAATTMTVETGRLAGSETQLAPGHHVVTRDGELVSGLAHRGAGVVDSLLVEVTTTGGVRVAAVHGDDEPHDPASDTLHLEHCDIRFSATTSIDALPGAQRFVRPPRPAETGRPAIEIPPLPEPATAAPPLPLLTLLAPLPVGLLMALLFTPMFALFSLMSPVMMLARWGETAYRSRRDRRASDARHDQAGREVRAQLHTAAVHHRAQLAERHPSAHLVRAQLMSGAYGPWQRRPQHADFTLVRVGTATVRFEPEPASARDLEPWPGLHTEFATVDDAVSTVDFADETGLGITGADRRARAFARSLVTLLAADRAPSDLSLHLVTDRPDSWDWMKWLPHSRTPDGSLRVAGAGYELDEATAFHVVVIDSVERLYRCDPSLRQRLLDDPNVWPVVLRGADAQLPACCSRTIDLDTDDPAAVRFDGLAETHAEQIARSLARIVDPDLPSADLGLPTQVALRALLADEAPTDRLRAVLGVGAEGPFHVDLAADGPHALVAGTTGAGKSELLRTLVASIASTAGPELVNFVLIDFKGGGAFDACSSFPHTLAVVTDLDAHLAERSLRSLRAELRRRETLLRAAGVSDIDSYEGVDPLPRLVVVIDEFATLAAELPDFLSSLVDVAQRGRSLGVHLILATQRPAGVVDAKIRANTNLRIALRVQDPADSMDVIDSGRAAELPTGVPGRALVRRGSDAPLLIQVASTGLADERSNGKQLRATPFLLRADGQEASPMPRADGPTELSTLVAAACDRHAGAPLPRPIWQPPLDAALDSDWDPGPPRPWCAALGIADLPDEQRTATRWFDAHDGNFALFGSGTAPTSTVVQRLAAGLCAQRSPEQVHLHTIDAGGAGPLGQLPHLGTVASPAEREHCGALLRHLLGELDRRRSLLDASDTPRIDAEVAQHREVALTVLVVAGFGAVADAWTVDAPGLLDDLHRLVRDGPPLGMVVLASAEHERAIPVRVLNGFTTRVVMQLAAPAAHASFGVRPRDLPPLGGHRAYDALDHTQLTLRADFPPPSDTPAGRSHLAAPRLRPLGRLVSISDLPAPTISGTTIRVPVGSNRDHLPVTLPLRDHALVIGPGGAGKTSTLHSLAVQISRVAARIDVVVVAPGDSPLRAVADVWVDADDAAALDHHGFEAPTVVLADDAELLPEHTAKALQRLVDLRIAGLHVIASGRPEEMRSFQTWTTALRAARTGIVLQPAPGDADILRPHALPTAPGAPPPGRGWLVAAGDADVVQVGIHR